MCRDIMVNQYLVSVIGERETRTVKMPLVRDVTLNGGL